MESEKEKCGNCGKTSLKRGNPTTERALMQTIVKIETGIVTLISYHHYLKIVGNNKL
jgi:hypothetical protein